MSGDKTASTATLRQHLADTEARLAGLRAWQAREQERCFHTVSGLTVVRLPSGTRGTPLAPNAAGQCLERCPQ
jgi:hypothetical protein